jgi:hypothetical protein
LPITVPGGGTVLKNSVFHTEVGRKPPEEKHQLLQVDFSCDFPDVPVLPETLLLLDIRMQEMSVDLAEISRLVLGDMGAAVQILRLAGREYGNTEGRPTRIEDCISDLGLGTCFEAVSAMTVSRDGGGHAIAQTWAHSKQIAQYSKLVADEMPDVNPDEAYLAGLLHGIGLLPSILGWDWMESPSGDSVATGFRIAKQWSLPRCVMELFCEMHLAGYPIRWSGIVRTAHQRADRSSIDCPFEYSIRPQLHRRG